jgi:methyl-accepting chemotaxis protein
VDLAEQIEHLSNEQAQIIAQISGDLEQVNSQVSEGSITAAESAEQSQEVSRQSALLRDCIEKFKIKK